LERQKLVGWILLLVGAGYVIYFIKVRLFEPGPVLERKEWFQFIVSLVLCMIGTANLRLAAMRARRNTSGHTDSNRQ
jgi:hypothetical protein